MKSPTTLIGQWRIQVIYLKSKNSVWREFELSLSLPHNLVHKHASVRHVTIQGDIYWLSKIKSDNSLHILKFNLTNETLTTLALPSEVIEKLRTQIPDPEREELGISGRQRRIKLGHRYNECLYLYHYNVYPEDTLESTEMEIWKYCDGQGFRKVLTMLETDFNQVGVGSIRPLGFTAKGDFIISRYREESLAAYIPQQSKLKRFESRYYNLWPKNANRIGYAFVDMETLIVP